MLDLIKLDNITDEIFNEVVQATENHETFNSAHEGYSVILEEMDELWDQVKLKRELRDKDNMRKECVQIAAMAIRLYHDLL
jgi:hypothetical protein